MGYPYKDEEQDDDRGDQDGEDSGEEGGEEGVVFPGMTVGLAKVARHEFVIAPVGFPGDVEDVAEEGDGADDDLDADVDHHADEGDPGDAANPGGEDDDEGGEAGEDVAEAGDEADETVEADADGGEGDAEPVVEEVREEVDVLVGKPLLGALAKGEGRGVFWREDFGFLGLWHWGFGCTRGARRLWGQCYNQGWHGGYSSAAERLTVAQDVVGSIPTSRPNERPSGASRGVLP